MSKGPGAIPVELWGHDPTWAREADAEGRALMAALAPVVVMVHHIGSTAIPGIVAKPILDLIPVVADIAALDRRRAEVEALGYRWWGEFGLPGRRYCTKSDPATGRRLVQLHCYAAGSPEITRHLAFRDYLRQHPEVAAEYAEEKARCQRLHPGDSYAYSQCKTVWIRAVEARALSWCAGIAGVEGVREVV